MGGMKINVGEETCKKCKQNCLLIHHHSNNNPNSPSSTNLLSFFKIMIGDSFSKFLHLPPKFSHEVSNLVGQEVLLEDSNARQWGVTVSKIKGSVAFKQGWNAFALDHGLKFGDFVAFHYVQGSHFIVQIFDKTGCAKLDFPHQDKGHSRKRFKVDNNGVNQNEHCNMSDKSSMNTQGSSGAADMDICQNHCDTSNVGEVRVSTDSTYKCPSNGRSLPSPKKVKADYMDESYYMTINRDMSSTREEHRTPIYDLSSFETNCNISATDPSNGGLAGKGTSSVPCGSSLQPQPQPEAVSSVKHQVVPEDQSAKGPLDVPKFEINKKNSDIHIEPVKYPKNNGSSSKLLRPSMNDYAKMANDVIKRCQVAHQRKSTSTEPLLGSNQVKLLQKKQMPLPAPSVTPMPTPFKGERLRKVKQEQFEMAQEHCRHEELLRGKEPSIMKQANLSVKEESSKVVKSEAVELPSHISGLNSVSCLVASNDQSYLELPEALPSHKGRARFDENVVMLRDSFMRLWPVLYHNLYSGKLLTSGWESFRKANSIEPGDECVFELEDFSEGIFKVAITRRF